MNGEAATEKVWLKKMQEQVEVPKVSQDTEIIKGVQKRPPETEADDSVRMTEASSSSSSSAKMRTTPSSRTPGKASSSSVTP